MLQTSKYSLPSVLFCRGFIELSSESCPGQGGAKAPKERWAEDNRKYPRNAAPGGAKTGWVILTGWDSLMLLLADRRSFGLIAL